MAQSLQIKYLRARLACEESGAGSFGICLVRHTLTYAEYAAVSSPASSFKIVLALRIVFVGMSCTYLRARQLLAERLVDESVGRIIGDFYPENHALYNIGMALK